MASSTCGTENVPLKYSDAPILFIYLLKQNRVILPDEIRETIQVRTSTVKTLGFLTGHLDKKCKLRTACTSGIGLIRVYTGAIPSAYCCRTAIIAEIHIFLLLKNLLLTAIFAQFSLF